MTEISPPNPAPGRKKLYIILAVIGIGLLALLACAILALVIGARAFGGSIPRLSGGPLHGMMVTLRAEMINGAAPSRADLNHAADILTARAEANGIEHALFEVTGENTITARLPKTDNFDALLASITQVGLIEFVDMGDTPAAEGTQLVTDFGQSAAAAGSKAHHTIFTGERIQNAGVTKDSMDNFIITMQFDALGKKIFADYTKNNIGRYLAIALDKKVLSCPSINSPIPDGQAVIQGNFTQKSANELAVLMRTKALPFRIIIGEQSEY